MRLGLGFNVRIDPTAMQLCTRPNVLHEYVQVDNPVSNNNVWATLIVTQVGGVAHPLAVRYVSPYWQIVYSDGGVIVHATCFNVKVFAFTQYVDDGAAGDLSNRTNTSIDNGVGVDTGGHGQEHDDGPFRLLQFPWAFGNPALPIIVTANLTPRGEPPFPDPRYVGVNYDQTRIPHGWSIYHEDGSDMLQAAHFNVWAAPQLPPP